MAIAQVGKVYSFKFFGGGYGAAQAVAEKPWAKNSRLVLLVRLDLDSATPPTIADVQTSGIAPPLFQRNDAWLWSRDDFVPWWAEEIGEMPPPTPVIETSVGDWDNVRICAAGARRYAHGAPKPNPYGWRRDAPPIRVDLGGAAQNHPASWPNLNTAALLPADGAVKWDGLRVLPNLFSLTHAGADRGLIGAIPTLPVLERLHWHTPAEHAFDLRRTRLTELTFVEVDHAVEIWLPEDCRHLMIDGRYDLAKIHAPAASEGFDLVLRGRFAGIPQGIERVQEVTFFNSGRIDCAALSAWRNLKSLRIVGTATELDNVGALSELKHLRRFEGTQLYRFDAQKFPADQGLCDVTINGLRARDAIILRKRLQHLPRATFAKTRSDKWIAENLDNPFRDWDADGPAFGKAAMKLWNEAVGAAKSNDASAERARSVVRTLVAGLNKLATRYEIDTLRREQACTAISDLVATYFDGALDAEQTQEVIDADRDW